MGIMSVLFVFGHDWALGKSVSSKEMSCDQFLSTLDFICIDVSYRYVCAPHGWSAQGHQKTVTDPPELKLQMAVSHHIGAEDCTCALLKSSQCS